MKAKLLILIPAILIAAVAGVVWVAISGWPPIIIGNREYRELISNFQQAQPRDSEWRNGQNIGWSFQVNMPERKIAAQVWAPPYPENGGVRIKYMDEASPLGRALYESVGFSYPVEIRIAENILYVCWAEGLSRTDHWVLAYDLANHSEIVRRKIDRDDLKQSH